MEVIGQSFNLPLEDMNITSDAIDIYSRWLFDSPRPTAVVREGLEQEFYQIIFHQYSLLFQPRITRTISCNQVIKDTVTPLIQRHVDLCQRTLRVFAKAGRTLRFSEETWKTILKVVLGITDYLLKEPAGETLNVINMTDELCDPLLQVFFELWLRSNTMDVEMWDILKTCFMRWTHRPKAIEQWSLLSLALTRRVQSLVVGKEGDGVSLGEPKIKLDLPDTFVYYAWHRILYLTPHPLQLKPANFTLYMTGLRELVDTFENTEGNTLLHMFGTFLFDAASRAASPIDPESQLGCCEAFVTLCKIFCQRQQQPFLRTYVEKFYASLLVGLRSPTCLPTLLLSCTELFASDLEGIRILVPDFIRAIKKVLPKLRIDCQVPLDQLRWSAIKVLSTIMCLPNSLDSMEPSLREDSDSAANIGDQEQVIAQVIRVLYAEPQEGSEIKPTLSFKFYILEILLMSLRTETSSYNMKYILHLINIYVIEDVPFCPGLVGTVIKLIQDKILTMQLPNDVIFIAFDMLIDFVELYDYVKRDSKSVARELVLALSRYVNTLLHGQHLATTYGLVIQAYECMIQWVLVSQWITDDHDCYKAVIETLSKGITILDKEMAVLPATSQEPPNVEKKKRRDTTFAQPKQLFQLPPRVNKGSFHLPDKPPLSTAYPKPRKEHVAIQKAADYYMALFIHQLGRFVLPHRVNSARPDLADDLHQLKLYQQGYTSECPVRCFLINRQTLFTVMDLEPSVPSVMVILRDTTGKYAWSMKANYSDQPILPTIDNSQQPTSRVATGIHKRVVIPKTTAVNEKEMPRMEKIFSKDSLEAVQSLMNRQHTAEEAHPIEPSETQRIVPASATIDPTTPRGFRLLLSQLGFLLPQNREQVIPLKVNDALLSEIESLDLLNGNMTWNALVKELPVPSEQFQQFIHCLGWPVSVEKHRGYKGNLTASVCETTTYYSDRMVEFIAHTPYYSQRSIDALTIHQQLTMDDRTCVVWIEDIANYTLIADLIAKNTAPGAKLMAYFFINPLKHTAGSFYWIRIWIPNQGATQKLLENTMILGPLVDGVVVSRHALGSMIRKTILSTHQAGRVLTDTFTRPYMVRKEYIEDMANRHQATLPLSE
ncbi:hypothetical protein BY458DRAFT_536549 [Sporodiniella umbellata]|nr:hypothetical protein BY458DRAFT_536549 [Sporodiniella umbellata]